MTKLESRTLAVRLMLAGGQTWQHIRQELRLTSVQMDTIRDKVLEEDRHLITQLQCEDMFAQYQRVLLRCLREVQDVINVTSGSALKLDAIKLKSELAKEIFGQFHESGIGNQQPQLTVETTKRISASGGPLVQSIMQRLSESTEPTRLLDSRFEEPGDFGTDG